MPHQLRSWTIVIFQHINQECYRRNYSRLTNSGVVASHPLLAIFNQRETMTVVPHLGVYARKQGYNSAGPQHRCVDETVGKETPCLDMINLSKEFVEADASKPHPLATCILGGNCKSLAKQQQQRATSVGDGKVDSLVVEPSDPEGALDASNINSNLAIYCFLVVAHLNSRTDRGG
ncbi:hypothetical protein ACH5RR_040187 [Cinchona calisaya]|uniref:Uncharacterized protein n=1 Tax=Cinchona calisaya TaxID=153742 RepID=A0ABD2XVA3_9GENT